MASHTSLDDKNDTCTCVCCKPKRRRRSCRPRCRPRRRQCAPKCCCRPRRRPRKMGYCMSKCDECGSNPCKKNCSCGCAGRFGVCDNKATKCPEGPNCDTSSDAFMNFLSAYNRKYGNSRNIVTVAPEAGRMWHDMNDEEREQYNYTSPCDLNEKSFEICPECDNVVLCLTEEYDAIDANRHPSVRRSKTVQPTQAEQDKNPSGI